MSKVVGINGKKEVVGKIVLSVDFYSDNTINLVIDNETPFFETNKEVYEFLYSAFKKSDIKV